LRAAPKSRENGERNERPASPMRRDLFVGLDIGASMTKAVIIDQQRKILGQGVVFSGADFQAAIRKALKKAQGMAGLKNIEESLVLATGYGRRSVSFAHSTRTEISCHARGSYHFFPRAHSLVDIGGQDSKVIKVDGRGNRVAFKMNRKCAAGTGAFLEEIANRLKVKVGKLNELAEKATKDISLGSYCTVFTATEILTKIRENVDLKDIVRGIYLSVIQRAMEMDALEGEVVMTGGVAAHNPFLVRMFEEKIGRSIFVPPLPQFTGAFGAALYALEEKGD
jgi:(R)-2-hydroxyacyl-CoA dehydratese activating ATPase